MRTPRSSEYHTGIDLPLALTLVIQHVLKAYSLFQGDMAALEILQLLRGDPLRHVYP